MLSGVPWSHFVQDNHVQEGDICIFQPLKTAGVWFTLMVHLIHQSKVGTLLHDEKNGNSPSPAGGTSSNRGRTMRSKANDLKIVHPNDGKAEAEVTPIARVKEEPAHQGPSNSKGHWTDDESGDSGGPSEAGLYILSAHAHLTDEQRNKVEDIVGSIQSQVPIYVAVMNKSSVAVTSTCILVSSSKTLFPLWLFITLSIPNYKSFQESWRETFSNLTKIIERNTKIYNIK